MNLNNVKNCDLAELDIYLEEFLNRDGLRYLSELLTIPNSTIRLSAIQCLPSLFEFTRCHELLKLDPQLMSNIYGVTEDE